MEREGGEMREKRGRGLYNTNYLKMGGGEGVTAEKKKV